MREFVFIAFEFLFAGLAFKMNVSIDLFYAVSGILSAGYLAGLESK